LTQQQSTAILPHFRRSPDECHASTRKQPVDIKLEKENGELELTIVITVVVSTEAESQLVERSDFWAMRERANLIGGQVDITAANERELWLASAFRLLDGSPATLIALERLRAPHCVWEVLVIALLAGAR